MDAQAQRLRELRLKAGLEPEAIADQIGISARWFEDLESEPGELEQALDMSQWSKLAVLLRVGLAYLVTGESLPESTPPVSFQDIARKARAYLEHAPDVGALEAKTGWDLGAFLKRPGAEGWEQRIPFFRDVCGELGLDWRGVLRHCDSEAA